MMAITTQTIITKTITIATMPTVPVEALARLKLFAWLSPAFPVGGFAFSHGLEWAFEEGSLRGAADLRPWLEDLLRCGAMRADAVLLAAVWRRPSDFVAINELALALSASHERRLETAAQGTAFLVAVAAAWPAPALQALARDQGERDLAYPVVVGVVAAAHAVPLGDTLAVFIQAAVANLVSASIRLGMIGQSEGQSIIADLTSAALELSAWGLGTTLDDLGTCAWRSDIAAMRHETQYSRLFRS